MTYMQSNLAFAGGIQELSLDEIGFVIGGNDRNPMPRCPREYKLTYVIYKGNGEVKEYKCAATERLKLVQAGATTIDKVVRAIEKAGELIGL